MKKGLLACTLLGLLIVAGCTGPEGPMGPEGPAGVSLIFEDEYLVTSENIANPFEISLPEILGRASTTFVQVYKQEGSSTEWTPVADGYNDGVIDFPYASVSWTYGKVYIYNVLEGDNYWIKVFQNE